MSSVKHAKLLPNVSTKTDNYCSIFPKSLTLIRISHHLHDRQLLCLLDVAFQRRFKDRWTPTMQYMCKCVSTDVVTG